MNRNDQNEKQRIAASCDVFDDTAIKNDSRAMWSKPELKFLSITKDTQNGSITAADTTVGGS